MSSSEWMILVGVWKRYGGDTTGTFSACGTGVMMIVCWMFWFGGRLIAGARIGR